VGKVGGSWETIPDHPSGYFPEIGQEEEIQGSKRIK